MAGRIYRESDSKKMSEESNESKDTKGSKGSRTTENEQINALNYTVDHVQIASDSGITFELHGKLMKTIEATRGQTLPQKAAAYCTILDPDDSVHNLTLPSAEDRYFKKLEQICQTLPEFSFNLFTKNIICPFIRNPDYDEEYAKSLGLARHQYHQFQDIRRRNNDTSISGRVSVARKLCKVFQEPEIIADLLRSPTELSDEQLTQFNEFAVLARTANESTRAGAFKNICSFLNETVSPLEQAQALRIPIDLYNRIVVIRKERGDCFTLDDRIANVRSICREINHADGIFNKSIPNDTGISFDQQLNVDFIIANAQLAKNNEKITFLRNACVSLNESYPNQELAKQAGVSLQQYEQLEHVSTRRKHQYYTSEARLALAIELCQIVSPNENVPQINVTIKLTDEQTHEFEERVKPIRSSPIDQRIQKLRDVCTWIYTNSQLSKREV